MHLARTMMTQEEIAKGKSPFLSKAWENRKNQRAIKEAKKREKKQTVM